MVCLQLRVKAVPRLTCSKTNKTKTSAKALSLRSTRNMLSARCVLESVKKAFPITNRASGNDIDLVQDVRLNEEEGCYEADVRFFGPDSASVAARVLKCMNACQPPPPSSPALSSSHRETEVQTCYGGPPPNFLSAIGHYDLTLEYTYVGYARVLPPLENVDADHL